MTKAGREKEKIEGLLREVRAYLPPPVFPILQKLWIYTKGY